jgi:hypothetical protein
VATWLRNLINDVKLTISTISPPIPMAIDNQEAIAIIKIDIFNRRTKYIDVRYHHFREYIGQNIIDPYYIPTSEMMADSFTKALNRLKFATFATSIGMHG